MYFGIATNKKPDAAFTKLPKLGKAYRSVSMTEGINQIDEKNQKQYLFYHIVIISWYSLIISECNSSAPNMLN